jgi:hypothetical protein
MIILIMYYLEFSDRTIAALKAALPLSDSTDHKKIPPGVQAPSRR